MLLRLIGLACAKALLGSFWSIQAGGATEVVKLTAVEAAELEPKQLVVTRA
jgi:hypothetical protein